MIESPVSTPESPIVSALKSEGCTKSMYGYGIFSKGRKLYFTSRRVGGDAIGVIQKLAPQTYTYIQALISSFGSSAQASPSTLGSLYNTSKYYISVINQHPGMILGRGLCFIKQSLDFPMAAYEWLAGERSDGSMAHIAANTALCYIPLMFCSGALCNIALVSCLSYSIQRDFLLSSNSDLRETSPTVALCKRCYEYAKNIFSFKKDLSKN